MSPGTNEGATTRRRLLAGGLTGSAVAVAGLAPGSAAASEDDDLAVLQGSPVNVALQPSWDGTPAGNGAALIEALDHAANHGLGQVFAPRGEYHVDNLEMPAGVHLYGSGGGTVLKCLTSCGIALAFGKTNNRTSGARASLTDLRIEGDQEGDTSAATNFGAVEWWSSDCRLERVQIITPRGSGIQIHDTAANSEVVDCEIRQPIVYGIIARRDFSDGSTVDVSGLSIRNNLIDCSDSGTKGIFVSRGASVVTQWVRPEVASNDVRCRPMAGILCIELLRSGSRDAVVERNRTNGGNMGISIDHGDGASVMGNHVCGALYRGIELAWSNVSQQRPNMRATVVANVVEGSAADGGYTAEGISASGSELDDTKGLLVYGNTVRRCRSGIWAGGIQAASVVGNFVQCVNDALTYEQTKGQDVSNNWSGIVLRNGAKDGVVVGNIVDGAGHVPAGIRFQDSRVALCVGNRVRNCGVFDSETGEIREIFVRAASEVAVDNGDAPNGVILGNEARLTLEQLSYSYGGVEDLRTGLNVESIPTVSPTSGRMVVRMSPVAAKVDGSGNVTSVWNSDTGNPTEYRTYPARELVLLFTTSGVTIKNSTGAGENLMLDSDFAAAAGDTLTLVGDGENWFEVSRSVN